MIILPYSPVLVQIEFRPILKHYYQVITFRKLGKLGRLGNQMFQYAGSRLYAELNGFDWAFPPWIGDRLFAIPSKHLELRHFFLPTVQLEDMRSTSWPERFLHPLGLWQRSAMSKLYAHPRDSISLYGYLQDETSLDKLREYRNRVRSWFRFRPEIDAAFRRITEQYYPWIAAHVRRGDLVKRNLIVPIERYLELLPAVIGSRNLFVASDSPDAVNAFTEYHPIRPVNPLPELPSFVFDFWMLKESEVMLAGGSTFAWWAAYLGNGAYYAPSLTHFWPKGYTPKLEHRNI